MTYIHFGNLTIPANWISAALAAILAALFYRFITGNKVGDWYWNGLFLYFLTWKLSYIVFHLKMFIDMPLSIVYFNGGVKGHLTGLAFLSIYLIFKAVKKHPTLYVESVQLVLLYFMSYEVVIHVLEQHISETLIHFILLVVYLFFLYFQKKKQINITRQLFIVIMLIELFIFSLSHSILSIEALTFSWIGITVLVLFKTNKECKKLE